METKKESNRIFYLEILRIVALFAVIYNHTDIYGWKYYTTISGLEMWINLFFACLCKISIPLFLMISGATLLHKKENISTLFKKRVFRMAILIALTSIINYIYFSYHGAMQMDIVTFFRNSLSTFQFCSYYLWMYISFLLVLPFLRSVAQNLSLQNFVYLFSMTILLRIVFPILGIAFGIQTTNLQTFVYFVTELYCYPIFGYFIAHCTEEVDKFLKYKSTCYFLALGSVLVLGIHCYFKYMCVFYWNISDETFDNIIGISVIAWFYFMSQHTFSRYKESIIGKIVLWISPNTLGAFLLSAVIMYKLIFTYNYIVQYIPNQLAVLIWVGITLIICILITAILRKIPLIRKIL